MSCALEDLFPLVKDHLSRSLGSGLDVSVVGRRMVLQLKCGHALTFETSGRWPEMVEQDPYKVLDEIDGIARPCFCVLSAPMAASAAAIAPTPIWEGRVRSDVELAVWAAAYALAFSEHGDAQLATRSANEAVRSMEDL